jgi:alkanesulfonate monooxygenase SsuD/methylene tetrahydromethanopterin reductase-like flavin-dependent oxidoreductase (luciferase family)
MRPRQPLREAATGRPSDPTPGVHKLSSRCLLTSEPDLLRFLRPKPVVPRLELRARKVGGGTRTAGPADNAGRRLMSFALESDVHDERLWMPITKLTGALGNTSCLVGTPEQVARAVLQYYTLGVGSFLIRGFDPCNDAIEFGRELIPRIKAGAAEIDRLQA